MPIKIRYGLMLVVVSSFLMCQSNIPKSNKALPSIVEAISPLALVKQLQTQEAQAEAAWVEEKWQAMSEDERLGQLFMVAAYTRNGSSDEARVKALIEKEHVGGLIMFQGSPERTAQLTNKYQALSKKVPLMMAIDGEWGLNMRLTNTIPYPRQLLMGAIQDNRIIYDFGKEVAYQSRRLGIHVNFAPVVDVNNNAANPVIGDRSFGENRENVTAKSYQYMLGMQDHNLIACAKHFPGHGDTDVDSHYDLPVIKHSRSRLDSVELYPFRSLIQHGVRSIMVAHLHIPAIDSTPNLPTTLSPKAIDQLLKKELNYQGLIFTDAMGMKGVTKHFANGEADLKAVQAGVDVLLMSPDVGLAKKKIKAALADGSLKWDDLEQRIRKILAAKYRLGLDKYSPVEEKNVVKDLNHAEAQALYEKIIGAALTLTRNPNELLPIRRTADQKIASLSIGSGRKTYFQRELDRYGVKNHYYSGASIVGSNKTRLLNSLKKQDIVLIGLHRVGKLPQEDFNLSKSARAFINELGQHTKVVLVVFGNPYSLKFFEAIPHVACAYINDQSAQKQAAQAIFGGLPFLGKLPVTASATFKYGMGVETKTFRLPYAQRPEEVGMSSEKLKEVDKIAQEAISKGATPGCQVLVVKDGKIAFHKAYGHFTYKKRRAVSTADVYDLASVTKVAATTLSIMKLYEDGKLDIDKKMGDYLPELRGTNKYHLRIRDVLAHQAGLKPWIPFYTKTLTADKKPAPKYYKSKPNNEFCIRVSEGVYLCKSQLDTVLWQRIYNQDLRGSTNYRYSDLGFYMFTKLIEKVSGQPLDQYVSEQFYQPMGLEHIGFNPLEQKIPKSIIVPTEEDDYYRYQRLQGDVHDMGAAMLGGVAGHAGLFASAADLAAIFQMLIDEGVYQNRRYLKAETIQKFTAIYSSKSRRGLGFDRKEKTTGQSSVNVAWQASDQTFGHLGFTGIGAWADPEQDLVFIFLSNRTYPNMENMKLIQLDIRTRIQEVCYDAVIQKKPQN